MDQLLRVVYGVWIIVVLLTEDVVLIATTLLLNLLIRIFLI